MCGRVPAKGSRKHGLQSPLQPYQILVWVTIACSILLFFFLCVPFFANETQRGVFTGLYLLLMAVGFSAFLTVSLTDPALKNGNLPAGEGIVSKQCTTCGSTMIPSTKHCYHCHKCVEGFDHHCLYLNTCIGKYNYTSFYLLISCLSTLVLLQSCVIALLLATYSTPEVAANTAWTVLSPRGYMILLAATAFIPMGGFLLILSLLGFHAWIICWGVTTYNWILDRRHKGQLKLEAKEMKRAKERLAEEQRLLAKQAHEAIETASLHKSDSNTPAGALPPEQVPLHVGSLAESPSPVTIHTAAPPVAMHVKSPDHVDYVPAALELTPRGGERRASVSLMRHSKAALEAEDGDKGEDNELLDTRASMSVELPLSYLGIDLGERPRSRRSSKVDVPVEV